MSTVFRHNATSFVGTLWGNNRADGDNRGGNVYQLDTGRRYRLSQAYQNSEWILQNRSPVVTRGYHEHQDGSRLRIIGDEFARTTPDRVYLLDDAHRDNYSPAVPPLVVTDLHNDHSLTNHNGHVRLVRGIHGSLNGYAVAKFTGSQDEVLHEIVNDLLGTKSFILKGEFRIESLFTDESLISYGDTNDGGTSVRIGLTADDEVIVRLRDAAGAVSQKTFPGLAIRDLDWHTFLLLVDRPKNKVTLFVSNDHYECAFVESWDLPANFGTLTSTGARFVIGGRQRGSATHGNYTGEASNVHVYTWENDVDYNVIPLLLAGIREGCAKDITITHDAQGDTRFNSEVTLSGSSGAYAYALANLDEGKYDIFFSQRYNTDAGSYQIFLDNIDKGGFSLHAASPFDFVGFIDNIDFDKGFHFVKIRINDRPASSTGDNIRFNNILFNKKDGPNNGGAASFLILGDELRTRSSSVILNQSNGKAYNNAITNTDGAPDGSFAQGELFLSGGSYKFDITATKLPDGGIVEVLFNGRKILSYDGYASGASPPVQEERHIVLPQGRNIIRVQVNGKNSASTGYKMNIHAIRGILQSGTSFSDGTQVFATDEDFSLREGGGFGYGLSQWSGYLFGIDRWADGTNLKSQYTRWFSGGVYKASLSIRQTSLGGTQKITVENDGVTIPPITVFESVNYEGPDQNIEITETLVTIPRGYHHVTFDNLANGSNNRCFNPFNALRFTLLTRTPVGGDVDLKTRDEDGLVVLGRWRAGQPGNAATMLFGDITPEKYDEVIAKFNGRSDGGAITLGLQINDITASNYKKTGGIHINGAEQIENFAQRSELILASNGTITGNAQTFTAVVSMFFAIHETTGKWISHGLGNLVTHVIGYEDYSWLITGDNTPELRKLRFTAAQNNWSELSEIIVYGRRRKA